jgi:hypothetical protein
MKYHVGEYAEPYRQILTNKPKANKVPGFARGIGHLCCSHKFWYAAKYPQELLDRMKKEGLLKF